MTRQAHLGQEVTEVDYAPPTMSSFGIIVFKSALAFCHKNPWLAVGAQYVGNG